MKLLWSLLITLGVGIVAGIATIANISSWYVHINKPVFNPPNEVFGPVWTILYILMGFSLYFVWKSPSTSNRSKALRLFAVQLFLNFCWSFIFFYFHQIGLALADIILLWIFIIFTIISFARISKLSAWLLVPYISWVSFALILNASIYHLN